MELKVVQQYYKDEAQFQIDLFENGTKGLAAQNSSVFRRVLDIPLNLQVRYIISIVIIFEEQS